MIGSPITSSPTFWRGELLAEREQKWSAFINDPEWVKARDESEKDGPIVANVVSSILQPTSFSSVR